MAQIHKQFTTEQVKVLLQSYMRGHISREEVQETLGIKKTRFFALLKQYRAGGEDFTVEYVRKSPGRLSEETEAKIRAELLRERELVENKELPISDYNYAALTDRMKKDGVKVSTTTVIKRAVAIGCYQAKRKKKARHDREVITAAIGGLIQHDASLHRWSPYADEKWTLITSLDDHSRMILYADFVETETTWAHIQAAQSLMQNFGIPQRYYVDNLRIFRFVQHRDSVWKKMVMGTDDVNTQWRRVLATMNTDVTYALSPQAKGKIERPYRWLQDRIVRTCALEHISSINDARHTLSAEIHRYNYRQVHSTTREIPAVRFERARQENRSLFRPFALPVPFVSVKDVFCLRHSRCADGYRKVSFAGQSFQVPNIEPRQELDLHLIPDLSKNLVEVRVWSGQKMVHSLSLPLDQFGPAVHF